MHLADHIRPLLRDHDCVIIPDFGGLVADASPARAQPGRQALSPPTKLVAFNQALTRNDGLLVDALSHHLGLSIAQAREAVRTAVAGLQQELDATNRTELPGIGIFRRAVGRGLAFEYTGTDNLLPAAFGLPELAARPVRANTARPRPTQPALRGAATRPSRWARLIPGGIIALAASLLLLANYQVAMRAGYLPAGWPSLLPKLELARGTAHPKPTTEPQQATFGQQNFSSSLAEEKTASLETLSEQSFDSQPVSASSAEVLASSDATGTPAIDKSISVAAGKPTKTVVTAAAVSKSIPRAPIRAKAPGRAAAPGSTAIKSPTGRYYVIAGAYSTLAHAERGRQVLARTGRVSRVILPPPGSRLFRLTAADYPDLASAQREAQRLRVSTRCDYNTLKF